MAAEIIARGHRVVGVDGSAAMLDIARRQFPQQHWIHAFMENVDFDENFDAVICWDSLFHLPRQNYGPVLCKIHGWLVPGGRMMVSSGGNVDDSGEGFVDIMFGHEFFYDSPPPDQMTALVIEAGFEILRSEMSSAPDGRRDKGKWAIVSEKKWHRPGHPAAVAK